MPFSAHLLEGFLFQNPNFLYSESSSVPAHLIPRDVFLDFVIIGWKMLLLVSVIRVVCRPIRRHFFYFMCLTDTMVYYDL